MEYSQLDKRCAAVAKVFAKMRAEYVKELSQQTHEKSPLMNLRQSKLFFGVLNYGSKLLRELSQGKQLAVLLTEMQSCFTNIVLEAYRANLLLIKEYRKLQGIYEEKSGEEKDHSFHRRFYQEMQRDNYYIEKHTESMINQSSKYLKEVSLQLLKRKQIEDLDPSNSISEYRDIQKRFKQIEDGLHDFRREMEFLTKELKGSQTESGISFGTMAQQFTREQKFYVENMFQALIHRLTVKPSVTSKFVQTIASKEARLGNNKIQELTKEVSKYKAQLQSLNSKIQEERKASAVVLQEKEVQLNEKLKQLIVEDVHVAEQVTRICRMLTEIADMQLDSRMDPKRGLNAIKLMGVLIEDVLLCLAQLNKQISTNSKAINLEYKYVGPTVDYSNLLIRIRYQQQHKIKQYCDKYSSTQKFRRICPAYAWSLMPDNPRTNCRSIKTIHEIVTPNNFGPALNLPPEMISDGGQDYAQYKKLIEQSIIKARIIKQSQSHRVLHYMLDLTKTNYTQLDFIEEFKKQMQQVKKLKDKKQSPFTPLPRPKKPQFKNSDDQTKREPNSWQDLENPAPNTAKQKQLKQQISDKQSNKIEQLQQQYQSQSNLNFNSYNQFKKALSNLFKNQNSEGQGSLKKMVSLPKLSDIASQIQKKRQQIYNRGRIKEAEKAIEPEKQSKSRKKTFSFMSKKLSQKQGEQVSIRQKKSEQTQQNENSLKHKIPQNKQQSDKQRKFIQKKQKQSRSRNKTQFMLKHNQRQDTNPIMNSKIDLNQDSKLFQGKRNRQYEEQIFQEPIKQKIQQAELKQKRRKKEKNINSKSAGPKTSPLLFQFKDNTLPGILGIQRQKQTYYGLNKI